MLKFIIFVIRERLQEMMFVNMVLKTTNLPLNLFLRNMREV